MKKANWVGLAIVGVGVATTACGDTDEPTVEDYNDVAAAMAPLVVGEDGDEQAMADVVEAALGELPEDFSPNGEGTFSGERGSIEYRYSLECRNMQGQLQAECGLLTNTAEASVEWTGAIDTDRYEVAIDRSGTWSLTNLRSNAVTLNGNGSYDTDSDLASLDGNRTRSYEMGYSATYEGIQIDKQSLRAIGGRAIFDVIAERTANNQAREVAAFFEIRAEVIFSEEGPELILDDTHRYDFDVKLNGTVGVIPLSGASN